MADVEFEEERRQVAATVIQHRWGEYVQRKTLAQGAVGGDRDRLGAGGGGLFGEDGERKEQSEEEILAGL